MSDEEEVRILGIQPRRKVNEADFMFNHDLSLEERTILKMRWGPGPWREEPDRLEWWCQGMPCLVLRGGLGQLNGYVGVPVGHPWYEEAEPGAEAHGGITWTGKDDETISWQGLGGPIDERWWVGFDCGHAWDIQPGLDAGLQTITGSSRPHMPGSVYRDLTYVHAQVEDLAIQAALALGTPGEDPL